MQNKSKTDELELAKEEKSVFFATFCLKEFFNISVLSQFIFSVLNNLPEYVYFDISKNITSYNLLVCF